MLVDSHAHLNHEDYRGEVEQVLARAREAGVVTIVNVGFDLPSSEAAVAQAHELPGVFAAVGMHPHDARTLDREALARLEELAHDEAVVAVGEIGLDFYRDLSPRDVQRGAFRRMLDLAEAVGKPVIIHNRDAHAEVLAILAERMGGGLRGVMHCFSGDEDFARRCVELGFHVGIAGPITFRPKRGAAGPTELEQVASAVPLDRLLVETDCPWLAPEPRRGRRNEPAYVRFVAARVAELRGMAPEELAEATSENAFGLFGIRAPAG